MLKQKKIIHMIVGLGNGGAERMLYNLISSQEKERYNIEVISMTQKGKYGPLIEEQGIKVHELNMNKSILNFGALLKCLSLVKGADVLQTWMYHADLLGFIVGKINKVPKIIWGIRHSNLDLDKNKKLTVFIAKINSVLSKYVDSIVSCSIVATQSHIKFGYKKNKIVTIPNGFDLKRFKFNQNARKDICNQLNIEEDNKIISMVGRWNILKDHKNLIKAFYQVTNNTHMKIKLLLIGPNINKNNEELVSLIMKYDLGRDILLLDIRDDIPNIMSASNLLISSSSGEGFPNVIGEAMACGTICVVTDVGDSAYIVGDTGFVVPPQNSEALASAILKGLELNDKDINIKSKKAKFRVEEEFEISKIVKKYESLY
jgi:glycosyltransferase involved in cell wall biosynthesis